MSKIGKIRPLNIRKRNNIDNKSIRNKNLRKNLVKENRKVVGLNKLGSNFKNFKYAKRVERSKGKDKEIEILDLIEKKHLSKKDFSSLNNN